MTSRQSRDKGARTERAILLQAQGIAAMKISGLYKSGADITVPLLGVDHAEKLNAVQPALGSSRTGSARS
jgi:hypothetical protein